MAILQTHQRKKSKPMNINCDIDGDIMRTDRVQNIQSNN